MAGYKRIFSDFNNNIKDELEQGEKNPKPAELAFYNDKLAKSKTAYENASKEIWKENRKIKKYKEVNPAYAQTLTDNRDEKTENRKAIKAIYDSRKNDIDRVTGKNYPVQINLQQFPNSTLEENRKPLVVDKNRLVKMANPALYILTEQRNRIKHELNEGAAIIGEMLRRVFTLSDEEAARLARLQGSQKGLNILHQKALASILMHRNGYSYEETLEEYPDLLTDLVDAADGGETGSASAPFFYVPMSGYIDIL